MTHKSTRYAAYDALRDENARLREENEQLRAIVHAAGDTPPWAPPAYRWGKCRACQRTEKYTGMRSKKHGGPRLADLPCVHCGQKLGPGANRRAQDTVKERRERGRRRKKAAGTAAELQRKFSWPSARAESESETPARTSADTDARRAQSRATLTRSGYPKCRGADRSGYCNDQSCRLCYHANGKARKRKL